MNLPLRVLMIEDSASDAALEVRALEAGGYQVIQVVVETAGEMRSALAGQIFDIILADHNLPQFDAPGALAILKESAVDIPFVVVSGSIGEENAVELMKAGAHDYVLKDKLSRLPFVVEHVLQDADDRRKLVQVAEMLKQDQQHQLQVKDQFLSRMSHELRSPLTPIHQFVTILLDGLSARSCLMLAVQVDGHEILTVEGIAPSDEKMHPLQEAFRDNHGLQCGFCTPGMLTTLIEFLRDNPDPTEQEVRVAISGNLCRCTGYQGIVAAALDAAKRLQDAKAAQ